MSNTSRVITTISVSLLSGALCLLTGLPRLHSGALPPQTGKNPNQTTTTPNPGSKSQGDLAKEIGFSVTSEDHDTRVEIHVYGVSKYVPDGGSWAIKNDGTVIVNSLNNYSTSISKNPDGSTKVEEKKPDGTLDPYLSFTQSVTGNRTDRMYQNGRQDTNVKTPDGGSIYIELSPPTAIGVRYGYSIRTWMNADGTEQREAQNVTLQPPSGTATVDGQIDNIILRLTEKDPPPKAAVTPGSKPESKTPEGGGQSNPTPPPHSVLPELIPDAAPRSPDDKLPDIDLWNPMLGEPQKPPATQPSNPSTEGKKEPEGKPPAGPPTSMTPTPSAPRYNPSGYLQLRPISSPDDLAKAGLVGTSGTLSHPVSLTIYGIPFTQLYNGYKWQVTNDGTIILTNPVYHNTTAISKNQNGSTTVVEKDKDGNVLPGSSYTMVATGARTTWTYQDGRQSASIKLPDGKGIIRVVLNPPDSKGWRTYSAGGWWVNGHAHSIDEKEGKIEPQATPNALEDRISTILNDALNTINAPPPAPGATPESKKETEVKPETPPPPPTLPPVNPTSMPGYSVQTIAATGLNTIQFTTPQGVVAANVTNDLAVGDTFSGSVETVPTGKTETERTGNESELSGYVLKVGQQPTSVGEPNFIRHIPSTLSLADRTIQLVRNGQTVATTELPISPVPPPPLRVSVFPTGGQAGKLLPIREPCNGIFDKSDYVKIGNTTLPEVAESPRMKVVRNTSPTRGPTELVDSENGHVTEVPFQEFAVQLSAPLHTLLDRQTEILTTTVVGLKGITQDLPGTLTNNSTNVSLSGGNLQSFVVHPSQVSLEGTWSTQNTLTGIHGGPFNLTATVVWKGIYLSPTPYLPGGMVATLATTPVQNSTTGTTLTHPGTTSTTTLDHKTGQTTVNDSKTGAKVTVDPKTKKTTVTDNQTNKSTTVPHDKNGSAGGKDGEPKVDVKVDEHPNNDGTNTTTTTITITNANGQTNTVTVTSTTDGAGGHTTDVTDPEDPNSKTSTTVDKNGDVTKTGTTTKNPDGTKTETSTDPKTGVSTYSGPNGSYTINPDPNGGQTRIDWNKPDGTGGVYYVPAGSNITPNPAGNTDPLPFKYTTPPTPTPTTPPKP